MFLDIAPSSCSCRRKACSPQLLCDLSFLGLSFHICERGIIARNHFACYTTSSPSVRHAFSPGTVSPASRAQSIPGALSSGSFCSLFFNSFLDAVMCPELVANHPWPGPPAFFCLISLLVPESHLLQVADM